MGLETMALAAAGVKAAGELAGGVDAFQRSRYEAAVLGAQAEAARGDAGVEAQLALEDGAREIGRGMVIAAQGGGGGAGSAHDVLADYSRQNSYEVRRIGIAGDNASRAALADARQAKRSGNFALFGSVVRAGAAVAGSPNAEGDGTLLTDAIKRRRARGGGERVASRQPMTPARAGVRIGPLVGGEAAPAPLSRRPTVAF